MVSDAWIVVAGVLSASALLAIGAIHFGRNLFCRLALALVPLGLGMWSAHLFFHLVTGWRSIVPVIQRFLGVGTPEWSMACSGVAPDGLVTFELLLLDGGLLVSLYIGWRTAKTLHEKLAFAAFATALWACGVLILLRPMQMRGMLS